MKLGDIILVPFPFSDLSKSKVRPALVVSNNEDPGEENLIICEVTTKNRKKREIQIRTKDLKEGSLPRHHSFDPTR